MAATSFTPISLYYSSTASNVPTAGNLVAGELAINTNDGVLYYKDSSGVVQSIASKAVNSGSFTNLAYTGTLTGGTGVVNLGSGQFYKNAGGDIGIGTSSFTYTAAGRGVLELNGTSSSLFALKHGNAVGGYLFDSGTTFTLNGSTDIPVGFFANGTGYVNISTAGAERVRIDSSGRLLVGTTTAQGGSTTVYGSANPLWTNCTAAGASALAVQNSGAAVGSAVSLIAFQVGSGNGTTIGSVTYNGTLTVYATTSDSRVKTDNGVATETSVIDDTVIHDFTWKNGVKDKGVFAQEAYKVKPSAVQVGTDDVDEEGNLTKPWGVDYSVYVPDLIIHCQQLKKIVQEQQALIESLTTRLTILEAK